jgi:NitT/TauT family transport system substrate-binding protein
MIRKRTNNLTEWSMIYAPAGAPPSFDRTRIAAPTPGRFAAAVAIADCLVNNGRRADAAPSRRFRASSSTIHGETTMYGIRAFVCGAVAALALLVGVAATADAQAQKLRVVLPTSSATLVLPLYVAQKQGWLDVESTVVSGDANAVRALLSGTADLAVVGDFNVFAAMGQGAKLKALSAWQGVNDYNLIVTPGINRIQDLSGKVFAATGPGGPPEEFGRLLFKKYGVDTSTIKFIAVSGGHANILQALIAGRADGGLVNTLTAVQGMKGGKIKVLTSLAKEYPNLGYCYNIVREETLADPKFTQQLAQFVEAGIKAARFIAKNPEQAADILRERLPDLDPAVTRDVVTKLSKDGVWGVNGGIEAPAVKETLDVFKTTGLLKGDVTPAQVTDYRFVNEALGKLGKE